MMNFNLGEMEIKRSKRKLYLYLLGAILMFLCSIMVLYTAIWYMINSESKYDTFLYRSKELACVISVIGVIFFGIGLVYILSNIIKSKPILEVTKDGFIDNSTMSALGVVRWFDVKEILMVNILVGNISKTTMIGVRVANLSMLIKKKPWHVKKLINGNKLMGYPPITINLNATKEKPEEVLAIMNRYWEEWKHNNEQENESDSISDNN